MYAYECAGGSCGKRAKGVQRDVVKTSIAIAAYRSCLTEETQVMRTMMSVLRSRKHRVHGERIRKIALGGFDSKKFILEDGVRT